MKASIVIWHDAHADVDGQWKSIDDLKNDADPYEVVTVGIVLDSATGGKKGHVSIAQSFTRDGYLDHVIHIPKAMMVDRFDLYELGVTDGKINIDEIGGALSTGVSASSRRKRRTRRAGTSNTHQQT